MEIVCKELVRKKKMGAREGSTLFFTMEEERNNVLLIWERNPSGSSGEENNVISFRFNCILK